jgi:hypothetical protein
LRAAGSIPADELAFDHGTLVSTLNHMVDRAVASSTKARAQRVSIDQQGESFVNKTLKVSPIILAAKLPIVEAPLLWKCDLEFRHDQTPTEA